MATAGSLITNICRAFGDPQQDYITDTVGLEWLTVAEQRFADEVMDIEEVQDAIEQAWDDSEEEWGEAIREYVIARVAELLN